MKKIITTVLLLISTASLAVDVNCGSPLSPCAPGAEEEMQNNPQLLLKKQAQQSLLEAEQAEKRVTAVSKRKAELALRKSQAAQKLLNFAKQRHEEARARRQFGVNAKQFMLEKNIETISPDINSPQGKPGQISPSYDAHKIVPSYKTEPYHH